MVRDLVAGSLVVEEEGEKNSRERKGKEERERMFLVFF